MPESNTENIDKSISDKEKEVKVLISVLSDLEKRKADYASNRSALAAQSGVIDACMQDLTGFIDNEILNLKVSDNQNIANDLLDVINNIKRFATNTAKKGHVALASNAGNLLTVSETMLSISEKIGALQSQISDFQTMLVNEEQDIPPKREPGSRPIPEKTKREYQKIVNSTDELIEDPGEE